MRIALGLLAFIIMVGSANAQALPGGFTCEQVRKLSWVERRYLIRRLGPTDEQVGQIKIYCKVK